MRERAARQGPLPPGSATPEAAAPSRDRRGDEYLQRAAQDADGVIRRLRHDSAAPPVIRRWMSYAPIEDEFAVNDTFAVKAADPGWHITIATRPNRHFNEFHLTKELKGHPGVKPHFFYTDRGDYKREWSEGHPQTDNYYEYICTTEAEYEQTEKQAHRQADAFVGRLKGIPGCDLDAIAAQRAARPRGPANGTRQAQPAKPAPAGDSDGWRPAKRK